MSRSSVTRTTPRTFDLVLFGATSFVGQIVTHRLVERLGADSDLEWAIAGRSQTKLDELVESTGIGIETLVADAADTDDMEWLAASARVIASTVGPYGRHGSELVAAVAAAGTDYCDLSGEAYWMQQMIDAHQATAVASGARLVHAAGFDSVPSDLGVDFLQQQALDLFDEACNEVTMRVKAMKGGISGGTVASLVDMASEVAGNAELRAVLTNPLALAPMGQRDGAEQPMVILPEFDDVAEEWIAPFVMEAVNSRIVHRSHALLGHPWGDDFTYGEAMLMGRGPVGMTKASALVGGMGSLAGLTLFPPSRALLDRFVLPKPGTGPSPAEQEAGLFDLRFYGSTPSGARLVTRVTGDRDPGYGSTAKMFGEVALALVEDDPSDAAGGFWTPSTAFGDRLLGELVEHAGLEFSLLSSTAAEG